MLDGLRKYVQEGFSCREFNFQGREGVVVYPKEKQQENLWIWRTEFFACFDYADMELLKEGWCIVYIRMSDRYGSPAVIDFMGEFYFWAVKELGLRKKADLFGFSRGGLYALNFAVKNPDKTRSLYLDAPVVDLASWPGGFYGTAPHLEKEWREACAAYQMEERELKNYRDGLNEKFAVLYQKRIPVLLVAGLADSVVPYWENGALLENYMKKRNSSQLRIIKKRNCDHHPHSLENPDEIVKFIKKQVRYSR